MLPLWITFLLAVWVLAAGITCDCVRRGALEERELAQIAEAQRNIQRAIGH